jgi:Ni,Fe-hydrogenase I small subunit
MSETIDSRDAAMLRDVEVMEVVDDGGARPRVRKSAKVAEVAADSKHELDAVFETFSGKVVLSEVTHDGREHGSIYCVNKGRPLGYTERECCGGRKAIHAVYECAEFGAVEVGIKACDTRCPKYNKRGKEPAA